MSTGDPVDTGEAAASTSIELAYADASRVVAEPGGARVALVGDLHRAAVRFDAAVKDPLCVREALAVLYAVVGSDFRYKPKDRTAYLAYLHMRREAAAQSARQSQQT